jgi:hypothetical protein
MKKEQKVIITRNESIIQKYLDDGWRVISITAQNVSTGGLSHLYADLAIVLEREIK